MPDQKLSQLAVNSPATTPLTGAELVYVVQGGQQKGTTAQRIADKAPATNLDYNPATRLLTSSTGVDVTLPEATQLVAGLISAASQSKLDSITVDRATLTVAPVRNNTGSAIAKGVPIYVTGSSGTTKTIAPADASVEATAANTLGLTLEAIPSNADGFVVTEGPLTGVNTSSLTEGGLVFLSETTGQFTSTRPTQPAHGVVLGWCVKAGAGTSGILYVKVHNGQELSELHDVLISSAVTGPQVLWRSSLTSPWGNRTLTAGDVGADATGTAAAAITALELGTAATRDAGTAAGNVPILDSSALIPSALLPGFVDDVIEFASLAAFPVTGETGKLYISLATNRQYRWSGSTYAEINPSPGSTDAVPEGSVNLYFTSARGQSAASSWWSGYRSTVGDQLATAASQAAARSVIGVTIGTAAGNVIALDGTGKLPAVDGSQLTNLPGGPGGASSAVRIDSTSTANTVYVGKAPAGSGEAAAVWSITRTQFSAAGVQTGSSTITAVTWTGRTTHTYP